MKDIVVTGMGAICAAGKNIPAILQSFIQEERNPQIPALFKTGLAYPLFEVKDFYAQNNEMRTIALLRHALGEALSSAGAYDRLKERRVGVVIGTTIACQMNDIDFYRNYKEGNDPDYTQVDRFLDSNPAYAVKTMLALNGPAMTVANACSSGTDALGVALSWLKNDLCDMVICGGADELNHVPYCGFGSLSVTSGEPCRPFDRDRKGLNLGEGAGIVILEKRSSNDSQIVLADYASYADAYHLTAPKPGGENLKRAIYKVLKNSGVKPEDIAFVNAHGTSTRDNDKVEGQVLRDIFGETLKFHSTKSYTGHTLGAAGGLEAVFACLGLREGWIAKNLGFENIDPEIGIAPVRSKSSVNGRYALSTSLAFGGNNSVLLFKIG